MLSSIWRTYYQSNSDEVECFLVLDSYSVCVIMDLDGTINSVITGYHQAVEQLCTGLFADPYFDLQFSGYGFNGCPVPTGIVQDVVDASTFVQNEYAESGENLGFIANYGSVIYHILKNAAAVPYGYSSPENKSTKFFKHLFYIKETENGSSFELFITSKSFGDIQEVYNKQFKVAKAVKSCPGNQEADFTVNSFLANKLLCSYVGNLSIVRPKLLFTLQRNNENDVEVKSHPVSHLGDDLQGFKSVFTIFCPIWPPSGHSFINRTRKHSWPGKDLINSIIEQGIHIVPFQNQNKGEWEYSFHNPEHMLIKSISDNGKELYKLTVGLIQPIQQMCLLESSVLYQVFVHCLFWFLEDEGDQNIQISGVDDEKLFLSKFLTYILQFLAGNKIPHYFIEDNDILKGCSIDAVNDFQQALQHLVSDDLEFLDELLFDTCIVHAVGGFLQCHDESKIEQIQETIGKEIVETLCSAFIGTLHIAHLLLFARLNTREDINECIEYHQDVVETLVESEIMLKDWSKQLVLSSLADLYLTFALKTNTPKSCAKPGFLLSEQCLVKAQELMEEIIEMDSQSGIVKLANFYFMTGNFEKSCGLCDRVVGQTSNVQLYNPVFLANSIEKDFLDLILKKRITLELLYSHHECLPAFLSRSLNLTKSSILGVTNAKVYILDSDIMAGLLRAMNLYYLGEIESVLAELRCYDNIWNKYQIDSNDKRNVAYINATAMCYLEIGDIDKGEAILKESKKRIPGFLNPARFVLIGQDYKRWKTSVWHYVTRAGSVALVVTALAIIGGVYRYKTVV